MANYSSFNWKDRDSTNPTRRKLTIASDVIINPTTTLAKDSILIADVERNDSVTEVGTPFNSERMNDLEDRINTAFSKCLSIKDAGNIDNEQINSANGFNLINDVLDCPMLEFFYTNAGNSDGIASQRIFISNYNQENRISLDQITCNADPENNFHLKSLTLIIQAYNGVVNIKKSDNNSKTLHYTPTNSWNVDKNLDIVIHKIIGYQFTTT